MTIFYLLFFGNKYTEYHTRHFSILKSKYLVRSLGSYLNIVRLAILSVKYILNLLLAKRVRVSQTKTNCLFVLALDHFQIQSKEKVSLLACAADAPLEFHFCVSGAGPKMNHDLGSAGRTTNCHSKTYRTILEFLCIQLIYWFINSWFVCSSETLSEEEIRWIFTKTLLIGWSRRKILFD